MSLTVRKSILLGVVAFLAFVVGGVVQAAPTKPWERESECRWWLSGDDGKKLRASIGQSTDGVVLTVADPVFKSWSESDLHKVELRFNKDTKRKAVTEGWVSLGGGHASMFGLYLDSDAMKAMDRATLLELRRDGVLAVELPLAGTPSQAELEGCVLPPSEHSDSE